MKILLIGSCLTLFLVSIGAKRKYFLMPYPINEARSWEAATDLNHLVINQDVEGDYVVGASYQVSPSKAIKPRGLVLDGVLGSNGKNVSSCPIFECCLIDH